MHSVTFSFISLSACLLTSTVVAMKANRSLLLKNKTGQVGHTETYIDPATGTTIDMGVLIWHNITVVKDYFKRFDIPITNSAGFFQSALNYDFRTGKEVTTPSEAEVSAAFAANTTQNSKYPGLNDGIFLPSPVPEELYMPFGEFVQKYGLQAAVPTMFNYNPGVGNILANPTLEQFRYCGLNTVRSLSAGFLTTARQNSSEPYSRAEIELSSSSSLLLDSKVAYADRGEGGAGIKLVDSEYNLPPLPGVYSFAPSRLPGLQMVAYATPQSPKSFPLSNAMVKADIIRTVKRLQKQNPDKFGQTDPEFVDFRSHAPYTLQVSAEDIKVGFYEKLYALQGPRNTYWTGAAFRGEDSSLLWKYVEEIVVPQMLAGP
ncbi:hypothetical protein CIRG_08363 [Coccidioides immitis RMSCC 2394]|uniref:Uncharacterized protein n=1 Tax=Coccidioides immitis RMSCC 2394 TaxID=404692 RepID=A0A0J7BEV6_COCIT|nr:hypothetical protein CIRG_08363 [Coccidioides immitis RMSCC 2394]